MTYEVNLDLELLNADGNQIDVMRRQTSLTLQKRPAEMRTEPRRSLSNELSLRNSILRVGSYAREAGSRHRNEQQPSSLRH